MKICEPRELLLWAITLGVIFILSGCGSQITPYESIYYEFFDTVSTVSAEMESEKAYRDMMEIVYKEMKKLHQLYDIYNEYEGINNLYTINANAGQWVEVEPEIIELLHFALQAKDISLGQIDIAFGSVLEIWHRYREDFNTQGFQKGNIPTKEILEKANELTDIDAIEIVGNQVKIKKGMKLDFGAIGKGFATEKIANIARENGLNRGIIAVGGDIVTFGSPQRGGKWKIGIQDPLQAYTMELIDTVEVENKAVVTSGNYERFVMEGGVRYHHIIDRFTLYPGSQMASVTVIHDSVSMADLLSTAFFLLPIEEAIDIAKREGAEALWITTAGQRIQTSDYHAYSQNFKAIVTTEQGEK